MNETAEENNGGLKQDMSRIKQKKTINNEMVTNGDNSGRVIG